MEEMIDIFTEQEERIGIISKRQYYSLTCADKDIPWIKCVSCFVIDDANKKILWEKRGKRFLDPGKLDLCSGHVQSGEIPLQSMVRELIEELSIVENDSRNLQFLGKLKVDYTTLEDETNRKRLKALVSIYALRLRTVDQIQVDYREVIHKGFLDYKDTVGFIKNSMTRMPYERSLEPQYESVLKNLKEYMFPTKIVERIK